MGNPAVVFDTTNPASSPNQVSRKAAKTQGLAQIETHKVLPVLASWREKTANALQQYVAEFMNRSTQAYSFPPAELFMVGRLPFRNCSGYLSEKEMPLLTPTCY